jgi:Leucine-rich repeat (LRR) protein
MDSLPLTSLPKAALSEKPVARSFHCLPLTLVFAVLCCLWVPTLRADVFYFVGGNGSSAASLANWNMNPNAAPGSSGQPPSFAVVADEFRISFGRVASWNLTATVDAKIIVEPGGVLEIADAITLTLGASQMDVQGSFGLQGVLRLLGSGALAGTPVNYTNANALLEYRGSSTRTSGAELPATMNGAVLIDHSVSMTGVTTFNAPITVRSGVSSVEANPNVTFSASAPVTINGGRFTLFNGTTGVGATLNGTVTINTGGTLNMASGTLNALYSFGGAFNVNGGRVTFASSAAATVTATMLPGSSFALNAGLVDLTGGSDANTLQLDGSVNFGAGTLRGNDNRARLVIGGSGALSGLLTFAPPATSGNEGNVLLQLTHTRPTTLRLGSDVRVIANNAGGGYNLGAGATLDINGYALTLNDAIGGSTFSNGGTLVITNAAPRLGGRVVVAPITDLTNTGSIVVNSAGTLLLDADMTVNSTLSNNGTVSMNGGVLAIAGASTITNRAVTYNLSPMFTNTLQYLSGNGGRTISPIEFPVQMPANVLIANIGGVQLPPSFSPTLSGTFTLRGTLLSDAGGNGLTLLNAIDFGTASNDQLIMTGNESAITIIGSGAITGSLLMNGSTRVFTINRSRAVLPLRNQMGAFLSTSNLNLVRGVIQAPQGVHVLATNIVSGGSDSSFIEGELRREISTGFSSYAFPVGRAGTYLPFILNEATATAITRIGVQAFATAPMGGTPGMGVLSLSPNEHWQVSLISGALSSYRIQAERPEVTPTTVWTRSAMLGGAYSPLMSSVTGTLVRSALQAPVITGFYALGNTAPPPVIRSFDPTIAGSGATVTIRGTNLFTTNAVRFANLNAAVVRVLDSNTVQAVVPAGASSGTITLLAGGGRATAAGFVFALRPIITTISPVNAGQGVAVTINGQHFNVGTTPTLTTRVFFGGVQAQRVVIESAFRLTAFPSAQGTTGSVVVQTVGGTTASVQRFNFFPLPVVTGFQPRAAVPGVASVVTITGRNFTTTASQVLFGGVTAANITVNSSEQLTVRLSPNVRTGPITVAAIGGVTTSSQSFIVAGPPSLTGFTPAFGGRGTRVTIRGRQLLSTNEVSIAGFAVRDFVANNDSTITAIIAESPSTGSTSGVVRVTTAAGTVTAAGVFTLLPPPTITDFNPKEGTSGTVVVITGTNFSPDTRVQIADVPAQRVTVNSPTQISAVVGRISSSGNVTVIAAGGVVTSATLFVNIPVPPIIRTITPLAATAGTLVTVTGENFDDISAVSIGGTVITDFTLTTLNTLTFVVPQNAATGRIDIISAGGVGRSAQVFTFLAPPNIRNFVPPFTTRGSQIVINGSGFTNVRSVSIGGLAVAEYRVISTTQIVAVLGSMAASGRVEITASFGRGVSRDTLRVLEASQVDSLALLGIFFSTDGANWRNRTNWATNTPINTWYGVTVANGRVRRLELPENGLRGEIPTALASLELQALDLSGNALSGEFPPFITEIKDLRVLNLANNQLSGILTDSLGLLNALQTLNLSGNRFTGRIPPSLCGVTDVRELLLARNQLSGTIPSCFGAYRNLVTLDVSENQFTGSIPAELGNPPMLQTLLLNNNRLTGTIPASLGGAANLALAHVAQKPSPESTTAALPNLRTLDLGVNALTGTIPASFASLTNLQVLALDSNRLEGTLGNDFFARLTNLELVNLSNNRLTGRLPNSLGALRRLKTLSLAFNGFTDTIPAALGQLDSVTIMLLDNNRLSGAVPEALQGMSRLRQLGLSNNRLTALPRLERIRRLSDVNVGGNALTFRDIEANLLIENFVYSPQDSIGVQRDTTAVISIGFRLPISVPGSSNRYQWFKGGEAVTGVSADSALTFNLFAPADTGTYVCAITNTQATNLTLYSRPIRILSSLPQMPTEAPILVFPANEAFNVSATPRLSWLGVLGGGVYEVQLSLSEDFTVLAASATPAGLSAVITSGLTNGVTYFWRVRARNAGGVGPWSRVNRFTTVPANLQLALSSLNFGRVSVGETVTARADISNNDRNGRTITIQEVRISDNNDNTFDLLTPVSGGRVRITAGQTIPLDFAFAPKAVGVRRAAIDIIYLVEGSSLPQTYSTPVNALVGRGAPLQIVPVNMDTVRVGRATLTSVLIINRGTTEATVRSLVVAENTANAFSIEEYSAVSRTNPLYIGRNDTATVILRAQPTQSGALRGLLRLEADVDSTEGDIRGVARLPRLDDIALSVALRSTVDSAAPGLPVTLELYLAGMSVSARDTLFRRTTPNYRATLRFNKSVLALSDRELRARAVPNSDRRNRVQRVESPADWWDGGSNGRDSVLVRFQCVSLAGETNQTTLAVEKFQWGGEAAYNLVPGVRRVFYEVPLRPQLPLLGQFTAAACWADGKRLVRLSGTTLSLSKVRPNPIGELGAEITYTVREHDNVTLSLYNLQGSKVATLINATHQPGEYSTVVRAAGLPSGVYLLVLESPSDWVSERVQIVK